MTLEDFDTLLAAALPPGSLFAVGGRVRDEIRESYGETIISRDGDYVVTGMNFDELAAALSSIGSVDRVGASFSILKLTRDGVTFDVGVPRRENSTGSGHKDFTVEAGAEVTLAEDLARRDFRMNMIARAIPSGEIIDPFNGRGDIALSQIDILHRRTFIEDPLRMLRACQFAARFGYTISDQALFAMREAASLVTTVSPQRIYDEFVKLFTCESKTSRGIKAMRDGLVLGHIWPEALEGYGVEQNQYHAYDVWNHCLATLDAVESNDFVLRVAALLHDVGKPRVKDGPHFYAHEHVGDGMAREMLERIGAPNDVTDRVCALVRNHMYPTDSKMSDAAIRRFIRRVGVDALEPLFTLRQADTIGSGVPRSPEPDANFEARVRAELVREPVLEVKQIEFDGKLVIELLRELGADVHPQGDRRVGICLRYLLECVTEDPAVNNVFELAKLLREFIQREKLCESKAVSPTVETR